MNQAPTSSQIKCHCEPEGRGNLSFVSVRLLHRYALRNDIDLLIHCNDKVGLMNQAPTSESSPYIRIKPLYLNHTEKEGYPLLLEMSNVETRPHLLF